MTKTERTVIAASVLLLGVLLITLRAAFLETLLIAGGVCCIGFGAADAFRGYVPPAIVKMAAGGLLVLCCVFVVKAVLLVLATALLVVGVLLLYDKLKCRKFSRSMFTNLCDFAIPTLFLLIGALLLFTQGEGEDWVLIVCGSLTVLMGGVLFAEVFLNE